MNQLQDVYGVFLHHRQKYSYGSRIVSGYSTNAQDSSCSTKSFRTLVRSWTYTAGGKLVQQSRISIAAKIEHSTDCVGTLKLNRRNICKEVESKRLKKGEIVVKHLGPVTMLNDVTKEK